MCECVSGVSVCVCCVCMCVVVCKFHVRAVSVCMRVCLCDGLMLIY